MEHPLEKFKYCPVCGSSHFEVNNFKSKKCQDCGFTYYANPCSATAAFIVNDKQEMLVVRRAKEPVAVRYCFRNWLLGNLANAGGLPLFPFRTDNW